MSMAANGTSSLEPSGSSSQSVGNPSPSGSPNPAAHNRMLNSASATNVLGSMGPNVGLRGINNSWQVWSNGVSPASTPISKRTPSMSSSASVPETPQPPQGGWIAAKPSGGAWEVGTPAGKDWDGSSPQREPGSLEHSSPSNSGFRFQHARQRQAAAAQAAAFTTPHKRDDPTARRAVSDSDRRGLGGPSSEAANATSKMSPAKLPSPFAPLQSAYTPPHSLSGPPNVHYDGIPVRTTTDEPTLGLRNLAIEDSYDPSLPLNPPKPYPSVNHGSALSGQSGPPQSQQRGPFGGYPQPPDYTQYYSGALAPEGYPEYSYGYDRYRPTGADPSLYPGPNPLQSPYPPHRSPHPTDLRRPLNTMYYPEFNNVGVGPPPGTQFYYHPPPHQPMLFHTPASPMPSPMLRTAVSNSLGDKKREPSNLQFGFQHQQVPMQHQQNLLMPGIRHGTLAISSLLPGTLFPGNLRVPRTIHPHPFQQLHHPPRSRRIIAQLDTAGIRSPLLEEFRSNKSRKWELKDIFGHLVEFSGDQHGSRFIQQKLETASSEDKQVIFDEILPDNILPLITDVFGNYVVQKLFEHGTQFQKTILARSMEGHVLALSLQMYGCRVVQKAIEFVLPEQQSMLVKELDGQILKCVKDANGNHVIQKLIERVSPDRLPFVVSFCGAVYELSTHPYGCRVLQRCFEYLPDSQTRPLLDELQKYAPNLMQDQFGNYVIQFVLERGSVEDRAIMISKLKGQMLAMSKHKFASNVCEKALVMASPDDRRALIDEIMTPKLDGMSPIVIMMKDQFANYVLQRALNTVEDSQREQLVNRIRPHLTTMRRYSNTYSKHLAAIERLLAEKSTTPKTTSPSQEDRSSRPVTISEVPAISEPLSTATLSAIPDQSIHRTLDFQS
ncbi:hypothetical protein BS47DRAFT_1338447 [Hydnum rufescens UP504]|uniref:Pumilio homology domain family member 3 n=1 Tax=Hydnum rufescens UP504 TaxID=1448309 RepID=A0A9P6B8F1_9AGAM|nr:hypothetical protein BS47DRAFT_1338447 [Hydnum rufescens UP504]